MIQLRQQSDPVDTQLCLHLLGLQIFLELEQEKQESATGDISESSKLSEQFPHMPGKLIGPSPNRSHFRLSGDKV